MAKYKFPKYRIGQEVNSPDGEGVISKIDYVGGVHWYVVNGMAYSESELKPT